MATVLQTTYLNACPEKYFDTNFNELCSYRSKKFSTGRRVNSKGPKTLQWVTWAWWCVKSPATLLFDQQFVQANIGENIIDLCYWPFVRGNHRSPMDSPHKGPVMRVFPFYGRHYEMGNNYRGWLFGYKAFLMLLKMIKPVTWELSTADRQQWWYKVLTLSSGPGRYFTHDDVIKWTHFPRYWPFVWGIHRPPVNFPHKGLWRGALMFSLICARIYSWVNNCGAVDLRRHGDHYDVTVMSHRVYKRILICCNEISPFIALHILRIVEHATTAQSPCHVENSVAISNFKFGWEQKWYFRGIWIVMEISFVTRVSEAPFTNNFHT